VILALSSCAEVCAIVIAGQHSAAAIITPAKIRPVFIPTFLSESASLLMDLNGIADA
jgi:hypothetical protein